MEYWKNTIKTREIEKPLLSIIIPTLNRKKYIERCLLSVFHEIETNYPKTEVIVIDGGSSDGTPELLKKYNAKIKYWVSEPDSGVSEAINKGIENSKGEIIRFLGDDDELIPGWFTKIIQYMLTHPEIDILIGHGDYYFQSASGGITPFLAKQPVGRMTFRKLLDVNEMGWPAPEVQFTWKRVFDKLGGFDPQYRYLACYDIWLRQAMNGIAIEVIPQVITKRFYTPDSGNVKTDPRLFRKEYHKIVTKYAGLYWKVTKYYPQEMKRTALNSMVRACDYVNIHPMRMLRKMKIRRDH